MPSAFKNDPITDKRDEIVPASFLNGTARTRGELTDAFNRVAKRDNWKLAIDAEISVTDHERTLIAEAVVFFAGCAATFEDRGGHVTYRADGKPIAVRRVRVTAPGYYAAVETAGRVGKWCTQVRSG